MEHEAKVQRIVDYLRAGEKPRSKYRIGMECEHFTVYGRDLETVPYRGDDGVESNLRDLIAFGYEPERDNGDLIGLRKPGLAFSIEPAGQFEISMDASLSIQELEQRYWTGIRDALAVLEPKGESLLAIGAQVKTPLDQIALISKQRYQFMDRYFSKAAYGVMKSSASVQALFDYSSEADFVKKYKVATALAPFFHALYDTAYIFDGKPYDKYSLRQDMWLACDPPRCGVVPGTFTDEFSYRTYAERIVDLPTIFLPKDDGPIYTGATPFSEILDNEGVEDIPEDWIEFAMSMVFFDIRAKQCLEVRGPDAVPYPLNFSVPALTKGIFYNEKLLDWLSDYFVDMTHADNDALKDDCRHHGWQATYKGRSVQQSMRWLAEQAQGNLPSDERHYLDPLLTLLDGGEMLHDRFGRLYQDSLESAVAPFTVRDKQ